MKPGLILWIQAKRKIAERIRKQFKFNVPTGIV
jgi:hypothetical protein